jgi:Protein of unknown function (DUF1592)/Protein of unknown function (DUF1588)/Protein of unknown function (DUF1595)/Protein of unknown function (DUF1587)/Protein of unknown function (DUF1585)
MTRAKAEERRGAGDRARPLAWLTAIGLASTLASCQGTISPQAGERATRGGRSGTGTGGDDGTGSGVGTGETPTATGPTSRFYRLSHAQWENTVRDLLGLPAAPGLATTFSKDAIDSFSNNGEALSVSDQLRLDYAQAAQTMAERISKDAAAVAHLIPAGAPADAAGRARAFIGEVGRRAHRRPLEDMEVAEYLALFQKAATIDPTADPFVAGVEIVLEAMLQSPHFLYRTELVTGEGRVRLDGYEVASKLSYALSNTMPDEALFAAAASHALDNTEGVSAEAKRMLDALGDGPSRLFHRELFALDDYAQIQKDAKIVPEYNERLPASMQKEAELFLGEVFKGDHGLTELLTAPFTFVDANLAPLYRVAAPAGTGFAKVDLDPKERAGFLTHLGFLTDFAGSVDPDIIHRGVFINERLLCVDLPPPATTTFPEPPMGLPTNRERIEAITGKGTCGESCHGRWMNPAGIAFEHYDVLGRYRTMDNGHPVNSADTYPFPDGPKSYEDAIGFSRALAESKDAHHCYARNWLSYLEARTLRDEDSALVDWLAGQSSGGLSVKGLVLAVVTHDSFLSRLP